MAKRFIDTEIFNDPFFMDLSKDSKIFYIYYITNCNHAGILEINERLCKFQTGIKGLQTVIKELTNRLVTVKKGLYFMPKFIDFQYPNFPNSNVRQQASAINQLEKLGLFKENKLRVSEHLTKGYEHDTVNVTDNGSVNDTVTDRQNFDNRYNDFVNEVTTFRQFATVAKEFIAYWTEPNKSNTKLKFEMEKTWDTKRRLSRWASNDFGKKKQSQAIKVPELTEAERLERLGDPVDYEALKERQSKEPRKKAIHQLKDILPK